MAAVGPITLNDVLQVISDLLLEVGVPPPAQRYGAVFVGPVEAARGMSFDAVFVPGLAERLLCCEALDGNALLRLMHGRESIESRCLAYWLEFKNDDEFAGNRFGGIGGGSALRFGIFQRQSDRKMRWPALNFAQNAGLITDGG
jgi:hypothetical protein